MPQTHACTRLISAGDDLYNTRTHGYHPASVFDRRKRTTMVKKPHGFTALVACCCIAATSLPLLAGAQGSPKEAVRNFLEQNIGLTSQPLTLAQLRLRLHATTKSS